MEGSIKRSRVDPSPRDDSLSGSLPPPLTCVHVSLRVRFPCLVKRLLIRREAEKSTSFLNYPNYRQWQFEKSLEKAVEVGNFQIDCRVPPKVVGNAAQHGLSEIIKELDGRGYDVEWNAEAVRLAIGNGHFELAKWLKERLTASVKEMGEWAEVAALQAI
ncbi:hypothetical protein P3T76_003347 [Phytophthora citrophthora]|uniref:Uncharacterized protein n=1 Tax=Phytophthora citrophthora TaxID=4793 RepID=A0AAD9LS71_9STRA|nr:hypothetical protein P3T76_003347 [Phytophthora citrophthora]